MLLDVDLEVITRTGERARDSMKSMTSMKFYEVYQVPQHQLQDPTLQEKQGAVLNLTGLGAADLTFFTAQRKARRASPRSCRAWRCAQGSTRPSQSVSWRSARSARRSRRRRSRRQCGQSGRRTGPKDWAVPQAGPMRVRLRFGELSAGDGRCLASACA